MEEGGGSAGVETFTWDTIVVRATKRGYLDLLLETAARIAGCERLHGARALNCLAKHCDIDPATLRRQLEGGYLPDWKTLDKLVEGTEVPLLRWLLALGRIDVTDLARALGQEAPQIILSPSEREWIRVIRSWTPRESRHHFGYVSLVTGLNLDPDADQT